MADTLDQIAERIIHEFGHCDYVRPCGHCSEERDAIIKALREARADALRDAADAIEREYSDSWAIECGLWLRARATEASK
jgi:hypothetical protein